MASAHFGALFIVLSLKENGYGGTELLIRGYIGNDLYRLIHLWIFQYSDQIMDMVI